MGERAAELAQKYWTGSVTWNDSVAGEIAGSYLTGIDEFKRKHEISNPELDNPRGKYPRDIPAQESAPGDFALAGLPKRAAVVLCALTSEIKVTHQNQKAYVFMGTRKACFVIDAQGCSNVDIEATVYRLCVLFLMHLMAALLAEEWTQIAQASRRSLTIFQSKVEAFRNDTSINFEDNIMSILHYEVVSAYKTPTEKRNSVEMWVAIFCTLKAVCLLYSELPVYEPESMKGS